MEVDHQNLEYFFTNVLGKQTAPLTHKPVKKIVIDCDTGADDGQAIILAIHLARKYGCEILGITTSAGNATIDDVLNNTQLVLSTAEAPEIPMYKGDEVLHEGFRADQAHYGVDGFGGYQIEVNSVKKIELTNLKPEPAADFLVDITKKYPGEITFVLLAPLTNIAVALQKDKSLAERVRDVFILGGSYLGIGNVSICQEYNFYSNPDAAELVINSFQNVTIVPWDIIKYQQSMPLSVSEVAFNQPTKLGQLVKNSYRNSYHNAGRYHIVDPLCVCATFIPEFVKSYVDKPVYIETKGKLTRGQLVVDWAGFGPERDRHNVRIVTSVNLDMIVKELIEAVNPDAFKE